MALNQDNQKKAKTDQDHQQTDLAEQNKLLQAQLTLYQEQLKQSTDETERNRLEKEAEKFKLQQEALEEEANLRKTLGTAFPTEFTRKPDDDEGEPKLNQQQMISIMGEAVGKAIDANSKLLQSKFAEIIRTRDEKLDATQNALVKLMANMSVNEARSVYPDFDTYREDIAKVLQATPGLSPDDAYLLAKARKSSSQPGPNVIETERPHTAISRTDEHASPRESDESRPRNARRDLREAIGAAIDKTIAARS